MPNIQEYVSWEGHTLIVHKLGDYGPEEWEVTHPEHCCYDDSYRCSPGGHYCTLGVIVDMSGMDLLLADKETPMEENVEYELGIVVYNFGDGVLNYILTWRPKDAHSKGV